MTLIGISQDDLKLLIAEAYAAGARMGTPATTEQQLTKAEAMQLAGFKDTVAFRQFCKDNNITPVAVRAKRHYYLASHILNPPRRRKCGRL